MEWNYLLGSTYKKSEIIFPFQLHKPNDNWWIGISDQVTEGTWLWTSNGAAATYKNWGSNEGNAGNWENCAMTNANDGLWRDIPCSRTYWTMCEKAVQTNPPGSFSKFQKPKRHLGSKL